MRAFLLTWNPSKQWKGDPRDENQWTTGNRVAGIEPGDRLYLVRQGGDPGSRGVVAVSLATRRIFSDKSWKSGEKSANYVGVRWCPLAQVLRIDELLTLVPGVKWKNLYSSGNEVQDPEDVKKLEDLARAHSPEVP